MATTLAFAAAFITVLLLLRRWQPVQGFHISDQDEHSDRVATMGIQILDIRDPIDFESEHPRFISGNCRKRLYFFEIMITHTSMCIRNRKE